MAVSELYYYLDSVRPIIIENVHSIWRRSDRSVLEPFVDQRTKDVSHYKLGDMGFVPRDHHQPRTRTINCMLSDTVRKLTVKSVAVQTDSAPKVSIDYIMQMKVRIAGRCWLYTLYIIIQPYIM